MEETNKKKVPTDWRSRIKRMSFAFLMIFLFFTAVFYWLSMGFMMVLFDDWGDYGSYGDWDFGSVDCEYWACSPFSYCGGKETVGVVTLYGEIDTYTDDEQFVSSDSIISSLEALENESSFEVVVLLIDSPGGFLVASEEVANALKRSSKKTIAVIRESGLSGAYLLATGADLIYASEVSSVGSIGVTMSYLDYSEKMRRDGVRYLNISSGRFKDAGDPDRPLDEEEREYLFGIVEDSHEIMVEMIAENRGLDILELKRLADGRMMLGQRALEYGLIDRIGGLHQVLDDLGKSMSDVCEIYSPYSY